MRPHPLWLVVPTPLALGGCAASGPPPVPPAPVIVAQVATTQIRDPSGRIVARASLIEAGEGLRVSVEAVALAAGIYGAHLHATGRCDPPGFTTAGPHWNPLARQHGKDNPQGMHMGDLPNLTVGGDGRGGFEYTVPAAALRSGPNPLLDGDGAAVIIHAKPDDYRTDPSGNSGARIACGVLG